MTDHGLGEDSAAAIRQPFVASGLGTAVRLGLGLRGPGGGPLCGWAGGAVAPAMARPQPPDEVPASEEGDGAGAEATEGEGEAEGGLKPYDEVITDEAETDEGVFLVHHLDDKVYYEIPTEELGRDFLWVSQIARTTEGVGYGGQALGSRVVTWERRGERVLLKSISYAIVADEDRPIAQAVASANNDTILKAFDVATESDSGAPVIDVTDLFETEVPEFSARRVFRPAGSPGIVRSANRCWRFRPTSRCAPRTPTPYRRPPVRRVGRHKAVAACGRAVRPCCCTTAW